MNYPWYALRVRSNFEKRTAQYLEAHQYDILYPTYRDTRRWSDRVKQIDMPLFGGYVFCRLDINQRLPVLQAPGVVDVVSFGSNFVPVPDEQIDAIRTMMNSGLKVCPWPFVEVGEYVRLERGPLAGLEGFVTEVRNEYRLVISVPLLQRSIAAEVDREWVTRASSRPVRST
jgi:transcription antitermination factor NusG